MPGIVIRPGDVVKIRFPHSNPPKRKICLCICIKTGLFLVINTDPYGSAPGDSQVRIFKSELDDCLDYDSILDTSKAYSFEPDVIEEAAAGGVFQLADTARQRIKYIVSSQGYLPRDVKQLVLDNL